MKAPFRLLGALAASLPVALAAVAPAFAAQNPSTRAGPSAYTGSNPAYYNSYYGLGATAASVVSVDGLAGPRTRPRIHDSAIHILLLGKLRDPTY